MEQMIMTNKYKNSNIYFLGFILLGYAIMILINYLLPTIKFISGYAFGLIFSGCGLFLFYKSETKE